MSTTQIEQLMERVAKLEQLLLDKTIAELKKKAGSKSTKDEKTPARKKVKRNEAGQTINKDGTPRKARAIGGYQVFSNEKRAEVRLLLEKGGTKKVMPCEVVRELARMWKELDADEQQVWKDEANEQEKAKTTFITASWRPVVAPPPRPPSPVKLDDEDESSDVELEENSGSEDDEDSEDSED